MLHSCPRSFRSSNFAADFGRARAPPPSFADPLLNSVTLGLEEGPVAMRADTRLSASSSSTMWAFQKR